MELLDKFKLKGLPQDHRMGMVVIPGNVNYVHTLFKEDPDSTVLWSGYYEEIGETMILLANPVFPEVISGEGIPLYECAIQVDREGKAHFAFQEVEREIIDEEEDDDDSDEEPSATDYPSD